jgi:lipoprotein signal peptidase
MKAWLGIEIWRRAGKDIADTLQVYSRNIWYFLPAQHHSEEIPQRFYCLCCLNICRAFGNLIDSMFYGLIFSSSSPFTVATLLPAPVVMLPSFTGRWLICFISHYSHYYPSWFPIASWRGQSFEFFSPVFNLADSSISIGVIALLLWQKNSSRINLNMRTAGNNFFRNKII